MKKKEIISDIDFFRLRLQEINDAFVEIEYELKEGCLCEKILGDLNFEICMLYEEGIPFIEKLCKLHFIKLKKF
ncbi:MAG: hypothetical protein IKU37_09730 [Candidatus Gastranaerophilales bacterium]|nr:hypothetical protein [Candidatus Gastranaerophilales bacterium]